MNIRKLTRGLPIVLAIFALLLFGTAVGEACEAWQHHECSANPLCPICHLNQQVAGSAAQAQCVFTPQRLGVAPSPPEASFVPSLRAPLFTTRAPPSSL